MKTLISAFCTSCALIFLTACAESDLNAPNKKLPIETRSALNQTLFLGSYGSGTYNELTGAQVFTFTGNHEFKPYGSDTWIDVSSTSVAIQVDVKCKCDNNGSGCSPHVRVLTDGTTDATCDNACTYGGCTMTVTITNAQGGGSGTYNYGGEFRPQT